MKAVAVVPGPGRQRAPEAQFGETDPVSDHPWAGAACWWRVLQVGVDGTDREINAAEYGHAPDGFGFLVIGHESFGRVEAVGPNVSFLRPGDFVVATVRRPGKRPV